MAALLTACHRGSTDQSAYMKGFGLATPAPPPAHAWPNYAAQAYRSFHKRPLTPGQASVIRKTLTLVKPCQRPFLRFAFPSNGQFVVFFDLSNVVWPHVLWTRNQYYKKLEGIVFTLPGASGGSAGIASDVKSAGCNGQLIVPK